MTEIINNVSGIYLIQNRIDSKVYVGSALNIKWRRYTHIRALRKKIHHSIKLQRAWNKYGEDSFLFSVLEEVKDKGSLIQREQEWIDKLKAYGPNGYNMVPFAGTNLGMVCSDETKRKIGEKAKGRLVSEKTRQKMSAAAPSTRPPLSEEHKRKISLKLTGMHPSEVTRLKMKMARLGRKLSNETLAKMSASMKGKNTGKHSPEHCAKISEALKGNHYASGYKHSEATRAKVAAASRARVYPRLSDEIRAKISASRTGWKTSEEARRKISESLLLFNANKKCAELEKRCEH